MPRAHTRKIRDESHFLVSAPHPSPGAENPSYATALGPSSDAGAVGIDRRAGKRRGSRAIGLPSVAARGVEAYRKNAQVFGGVEVACSTVHRRDEERT